jgi:hypothetical protein
MSFTAALNALAAIPKLIDAIDRLGESIKSAQARSIDNKYAKLKEEVNVLTKKIETATTNDQRKDLARQLNAIVSR